MVLVFEVVDVVLLMLVLVVGGIVCGCQIVVVLVLGVEGVWCGLVWLIIEEVEMFLVVKDKFLVVIFLDMVWFWLLIGKLVCMLCMVWIDEWDWFDSFDLFGMLLQSVLVSDLQLCINQVVGQFGVKVCELVIYFVGQVVGLFDWVWLVCLVVFDMVEEFIDIVG